MRSGRGSLYGRNSARSRRSITCYRLAATCPKMPAELRRSGHSVPLNLGGKLRPFIEVSPYGYSPIVFSTAQKPSHA